MATTITFLAMIHILIAFLLVTFVLLQDGKGGGLGSSFGSESSQTLFGATGAANFLVKVTRALALFFMVSCIGMTVLLNRSNNRSVVENLPTAAPAPAQPAPVSNEAHSNQPAAETGAKGGEQKK